MIKTLTTMAVQVSTTKISPSMEENVHVQYMFVLQMDTA